MLADFYTETKSFIREVALPLVGIATIPIAIGFITGHIIYGLLK